MDTIYWYGHLLELMVWTQIGMDTFRYSWYGHILVGNCLDGD